MKQRFHAQKLLTNKLRERDFLDSITVHKDEKNELWDYRKTIRNWLREGFKNLARSAVNSDASSLYISKLKPKFWTQGSCSYGTLNEPAHNPPQQIDLDDGIYFPMELVNGKPRATKNLLLQCVWKLLESLASEKGWGLKKKTTCARLLINERIHIDVPVYAIPEERYAVMTEALKTNFEFGRAMDFATIQLEPDEIYLALWDDGKDWIPSDPKELEKWFKKEVSIHGERLRRLCRYLKAWRDYKWENGGPSSIALMAAVAQIFDDFLHESGETFKSDCQALLEVAKKLPICFSREIINPVGESELFPNGSGLNEVLAIREGIDCFSQAIVSSLCLSRSEDEVVNTLSRIFGQRIPQKPDWVEFVAVSTVVKSVPAQPQKQPKPSASHRSA